MLTRFVFPTEGRNRPAPESVALEILRREAVNLVVAAQAMPQMTGDQAGGGNSVRMAGPAIIIAMGCAELPPGTALGLLRLTKPFSQVELDRAIAAAAPH